MEQRFGTLAAICCNFPLSRQDGPRAWKIPKISAQVTGVRILQSLAMVMTTDVEAFDKLWESS